MWPGVLVCGEGGCGVEACVGAVCGWTNRDVTLQSLSETRVGKQKMITKS